MENVAGVHRISAFEALDACLRSSQYPEPETMSAKAPNLGVGRWKKAALESTLLKYLTTRCARDKTPS